VPTEAFYKLSVDRQEEILDAAARQFAELGYRAASTNRIVRELGIAKGSLFYYFDGKEDLYLHILESSRQAFMAEIDRRVVDLPPDLLVRLRIVTEIGLDLLIANPVRFRVYMRLSEDLTSDVHRRYFARLQQEALPTMERWFGDVDMSRFRNDAETTFRLIGWLYAGMKLEMRTLVDESTDPQGFKKAFMARVDMVLDAVRPSVYLGDRRYREEEKDEKKKGE
jgi:AcrR family transcriptional regulator